MTDDPNEIRLPPPAFPPGRRRHVVGANSSRPSDAAEPRNEADAVFDALISPDEPLPDRGLGLEPEEGIVTGMGDDAHLEPEELVSGGDPYVLEVVGAVQRLAMALKHKGEAALQVKPHMSRLEATLRAYCVGYIAGRRAEDEVGEGEYPPYEGFDGD